MREVQDLLEEAAAIGGDIEECIEGLENAEERMTKKINNVFPDGADLLEQAQSLSMLNRSPYLAQFSREDSPIQRNEELPTLFCENLEMIAFEGYKSRAFAPNYRPNETDIRKYLETAVRLGYSQEHADEIMSAWNEKTA